MTQYDWWVACAPWCNLLRMGSGGLWDSVLCSSSPSSSWQSSRLLSTWDKRTQLPLLQCSSWVYLAGHSSDHPHMGCSPITCQVPVITHATLETLYTLHTCIQPREWMRNKTQCGSNMMSFRYNWDSHSKKTMPFLLSISNQLKAYKYMLLWK